VTTTDATTLSVVDPAATMPAMRRARIAGLAVLLAYVAAGCGGGSGGSGYTLQATKKCLQAAGHTAILDPKMTVSGSQGNLMVKFGYGIENIYVAFGKDDNEAKTLENTAVSLAVRHEHLPRSTVLAGVRVDKNVFYYADYGAVTGVLDGYITSCLGH
jgi:hypothetical protein